MINDYMQLTRRKNLIDFHKKTRPLHKDEIRDILYIRENKTLPLFLRIGDRSYLENYQTNIKVINII